MLRIYRRHRGTCNHTSERYRRCSCPIYVEGTLGGETVRRSLDQTNWEAANELVAQWTASGQIGVARLDIPTIREAVQKYFDDAIARQLQPATISKHKNLLNNRLLPWCTDKGYQLLKQLDVDALRQFRATWPDGPLSAYKNLERLRAFFWFCHRSDWIEKNPAVGLKPPKLPGTRCSRALREERDGYSGELTTDRCHMERGRGATGFWVVLDSQTVS